MVLANTSVEEMFLFWRRCFSEEIASTNTPPEEMVLVNIPPEEMVLASTP